VPATADAPYARTWLGARYGLRPIGRLLLQPRTDGESRIPREGGAVIAFNHLGFTDALLVTQVLARPTRFMVAAGVLRIPIVGAVLRAAGAFGVRRGESDRESVRVAIAAASSGSLVGIFPEGGLRRGGPLGELHRGAALIALRAGVPLVPVAIGRRPAFVRVGEPLRPEGDARTVTAALRASLVQLLEVRH
jgi:1-acyl-sn-glycerol-3-phosphate acyltransferase